MMRLSGVAGSFASILVGVLSASAQTIRSIPVSYARGDHQIVTVTLYPGHGTTLNFRPTGETIYRAWLDDPSQVTLDFDDPRCSAVEVSRQCAASIIHLRRIHPLNFPHLPTTPTTSLTVLTNQDLYKFQLAFPNSGSPSYYALEIQPDRSVSPPPSQIVNRITGDAGAQAIEQGLRLAQARRLIAEGDELWGRLQTFLELMRHGASIEQATVQAGVSQALIVRLFEMGS